MLTPLQCIEIGDGLSTILFTYSTELKKLLEGYATNIYYFLHFDFSSNCYFFIDTLKPLQVSVAHADNLRVGCLIDADKAIDFFSMYLPLHTLNSETQQLDPLEHFKTYITLWAKAND